MKIILEGDKDERRYTCDRCGTIFLADRKDREIHDFPEYLCPNIYPPEIMEPNTKHNYEEAVQCPICNRYIKATKGIVE